jgi:hypothetical protein
MLRPTHRESERDSAVNSDLNGGRSKWYEKYLPFVAKRPLVQIEWLIAAFRKGTLTHEEITPYIRLLLADGQDDQVLKELFGSLSEEVLTEMLQAADIYDTPKIFRLIGRPTRVQAKIALKKVPPPYEKSPVQVRDRIFRAVYDCSEEMLKEVVADLIERKEVSAEFEEDYERYNEVLMDAKILSSLYPKAKFQPEP